MCFWVFFGTKVQETLFMTPKDPLFVKVGVVVVVVNHGNQWEENGKTVIVLVKCLSIVYLEPVNLTLTLGMQFTINQGVLRHLEAKISAENSSK